MNRRIQIRLRAGPGGTATLLDRVKMAAAGVLVAAIIAGVLVAALILGSVIAAVVGILLIAAIGILIVRGTFQRVRR